jgi:lysozyme
MENLMPALNLIRRFEGCKLSAYQDICDVWTIGWGTAHGVTEGMQITQEQADQMLLDDCQKLSAKIRSIITAQLSDNQLCALISFAYNLGIAGLFQSTLRTEINAGAPREQLEVEFLKWNHAGGQVVAGLTTRRQAEADLFLS